MAQDDTFRQCDLSQGTKRLTAWIPARAAVQGASVEVLDGVPKRDRDFWQVDRVGEFAMTREALRAKQSNDRGVLVSIVPHKR